VEVRAWERVEVPAWELENPIKPLPPPPLGLDKTFADLSDADRPTPARVRLGRWLFYDKRLSANGDIACSNCHRPEHAFSEPTAHPTDIAGLGRRKVPTFVNEAWTIYPHFFWDGRASSLEQQALGPIANPTEMGNIHKGTETSLHQVKAYAPYFKEAFGTETITKDLVAKAIADYERTILSGDSPWDRWKQKRDASMLPEDAKKGDALFFGKAACNQCHVGQNFTDSLFHNLGVGWDGTKFADDGRSAVSQRPEDRGAFKTPGLRDVTLHPAYMHDGSLPTLRAVVDLYDKGGNSNPTLDPKIHKLNLTEAEKDALVSFIEALTSCAPREKAPTSFPR
jgi:cytochrome c peroxidase